LNKCKKISIINPSGWGKGNSLKEKSQQMGDLLTFSTF